jgi:hypothetical protein
VPHFLSPAQKVGHVEASAEMLRILHESEENHFEAVATGDEPWFQYSDFSPSSKMFPRSPTEIIPRTRQAVGMKNILIMIFFTGHRLFVLDILPEGIQFSQLSFVDYIVPNLKRENMNFHRRIPKAAF